MEVMVAVGLARRGMISRWLMRGRHPARSAQMQHDAVRIYRMSATEYMALNLDALNYSGNQDAPVDSARSDDDSDPGHEMPAQSSKKKEPTPSRLAA